MKRKRRNKRKFIIFTLAMIGIGTISYKKLESSSIKIKDNQLLNFLSDHTVQIQTENKTIVQSLFKKIWDDNNPINTIYQEYSKYQSTKEEPKKDKPIIYLYNTHQTEEYYPSNYIEFSINPTIIMNNYILEDVFENNNIPTLVEESSIEEILKENKWKYVNSYQASRMLMEKAKKDYPSLSYFIDIHRDSLKREKTTIEINGKEYAKILFIVGLENQNYKDNLLFTEKINQIIDNKYPNLSKGIYKKEGPGVNGVYNQDFSPNTILIEIGGYENTTTEVLNTTLAFAECFMEAINE